MKNQLSRAGRRQFWEDHIARCATSGLSQVEYCRSNKINIKSFYYWKRRPKGGVGAPQALVELPLPRSFPILPALPRLCVVIDRYRVEIGEGFNPEDLERVVRLLGRL
jgi:hypothetical protein